MVVADVHGYYEPLKRAYDVFEKSGADYLMILGDLLYFGPRNGINKGYDPLRTAQFLQEKVDKLILIRGNCDSSVDETLLETPFLDQNVLVIAGRKIYCTHGHVYNENHLPAGIKEGDVLIRGHFHIPVLLEVKGVLVASPGSLGVPKECSEPAYIMLTEEKLECRTLDDRLLYEKKW